VAGFYRYAVEEELLEHSPAAHARRPRLDYESHATGLDRNELGALLVAAGLGPAADHALISLLDLNGLRVSEATGADIEALGVERGHRTLVITRKGGKVVTIPLAPRTARAIDLAVGERSNGPVLLTADGRRLDRHGAGRIVRRIARRAGITKPVGPHTLRHAFITAALDAGVPLRDVQEAASHADPRTTMRYDRGRTSLDRHATYRRRLRRRSCPVRQPPHYVRLAAGRPGGQPVGFPASPIVTSRRSRAADMAPGRSGPAWPLAARRTGVICAATHLAGARFRRMRVG
jgi:integrase/recombinase XerD